MMATRVYSIQDGKGNYYLDDIIDGEPLWGTAREAYGCYFTEEEVKEIYNDFKAAGIDYSTFLMVREKFLEEDP